MTPWPNTATCSPSRTSACRTELSAIAPTRANTPVIGSAPGGSTRPASAATGRTASLRWPQIPCTTSPTASGSPAAGRSPARLAR